MEDNKGNMTNSNSSYHRTLSQQEMEAIGLKINPSKAGSRPMSASREQFDLDKEIAEMKALIGEGPAKEQTTQRNRVKRMQEQSTKGKSSKNSRQKTNVNKKWQRTAVAVGLAVSMAVGGLLAEPVEDVIDYVSNWWELRTMTTQFKKDVASKYTSTTFTHDQNIDYGQIAKGMEADGEISNEELLIAVDTLGEVNANRILNQASNSPAANVEEYMRNHNITTTSDWKSKTIKAMGLEEDIASAKNELDTMLGTKSESNDTVYYNTDASYGGK